MLWAVLSAVWVLILVGWRLYRIEDVLKGDIGGTPHSPEAIKDILRSLTRTVRGASWRAATVPHGPLR
jgi:hypothetical protein